MNENQKIFYYFQQENMGLSLDLFKSAWINYCGEYYSEVEDRALAIRLSLTLQMELDFSILREEFDRDFLRIMGAINE